jgi:hypothetical protein
MKIKYQKMINCKKKKNNKKDKLKKVEHTQGKNAPLEVGTQAQGSDDDIRSQKFSLYMPESSTIPP